MQVRVKKLLREIGQDERLPINVVHKIVATPWRVTANKISEMTCINEIKKDERPIFSHLLFGTFSFSEKKIKKLTEKNK